MSCQRPNRPKTAIRRVLALGGLGTALGLAFTFPLPAAASSPDDPATLVERLTAGGPRPVGSAALASAQDTMLAAMRAAGLETAIVDEPGPPPLRNLVGLAPGRSDGEIVLLAHLDSVASSPGALDDASGCAAILLAVEDLRRTPLEHAVRVVLFDAEELGGLGSSAWVDRLGVDGRARVLAALDIEMVGRVEGEAVAGTLPVFQAGRRTLAPGWLVHAALRGAEATAWPLSFADARWGPLAQLVLRTTRAGWRSDADALLAAGVPALYLSDNSLLAADLIRHSPRDAAERVDPERLRRWGAAIAGIVRRLDALPGRPLPEDEYLVAGGHVFVRRDLYWVGLALWVLLLVAGRPGRWRGAAPADRRREGSAFLPGFLFRGLVLLSTLAMPAIAAVLLFLPAALAAVPQRHRQPPRAWQATALLPALAFLAALGLATARGAASGWALALPASALLAATLSAGVLWIGRGRSTVPNPPTRADSDASSNLET